jgi:hypothetical protein
LRPSDATHATDHHIRAHLVSERHETSQRIRGKIVVCIMEEDVPTPSMLQTAVSAYGGQSAVGLPEGV